jgi:anti-sigma factor RsiW
MCLEGRSAGEKFAGRRLVVRFSAKDMDMSDHRCEEVRPELVAYLDGELEARARTAVAEHLRACAACRREVEALEAAGRLLAALPAGPPPSEGFELRLRARLQELERDVPVAGSPAGVPMRVSGESPGGRGDPRAGDRRNVGLPADARREARPAARRRRWLPAFALAAAVLILAASVGYRMGLFGGVDPDAGFKAGRPEGTPERRSTPHPTDREDRPAPPRTDELGAAEERELARDLEVLEAYELLLVYDEVQDALESGEDGPDIESIEEMLLEEKG